MDASRARCLSLLTRRQVAKSARDPDISEVSKVGVSRGKCPVGIQTTIFRVPDRLTWTVSSAKLAQSECSARSGVCILLISMRRFLLVSLTVTRQIYESSSN